jgi:hypothetical protein
MLLVAIIVDLVGVLNQEYLKEQWHWFTAIRPYIWGRRVPMCSRRRRRAR